MPEPLRLTARGIAWAVALLWASRAGDALRHLPSVVDLHTLDDAAMPAGLPRLRVVVPALNEQAAVRLCLESLLAQDYAAYEIVAVDDRSTDGTGKVMDELHAAHPGRMRVLHIEQLPAGWLGKTHAMSLAAELPPPLGEAPPEWLLFTDADIIFRSDTLRRALDSAVAAGADHLVLAPTTIIRRWDEAALLSFFQIFGLWAARPWRVSDPRSRDAIGIGAFNLLRAQAYAQVGGFGALRMAVVEDLGLARRVKRAGLRQRMVFGRDMVRVHWASGIDGLVRTMTKNIFAAFSYRPERLLAGCLWLTLFCIAPFVFVWLPGFHAAGALTVLAMTLGLALLGRHSGLSTWNALLAPFAAAVFIFALLRSMWITLRQRGIFWRGTFYSLDELRRNAEPL